jgi:putative peptidoglycan lipid II flippase
VPIAVLGQAASQASLPFFARLFGENRLDEFAEIVNASVYRIVAASLLASSWMMAASLPLIDLVYRRGHFQFADSRQTALYFFWFSLSLVFWSAQAVYARAFYAAGNTLTPMVATTIITIASIPVYSMLYRSLSTMGLAIASGIGIMANAVALAWLLDRRKLAPAFHLPWNEIGKAALIAVVAGSLAAGVSRGMLAHPSRAGDLKAIGLITLTWSAAVAAGLWITQSTLLRDLRRRT